MSLKGTPAAVVYLAGGLGNQIFMAAAGWQVSQRLQVPLHFETSFFDKDSLRTFELGVVPLPAARVVTGEYFSTVRILGRSVALPASFWTWRSQLITEARARDLPQSIGNRVCLVGYFQESQYFSEIRQELAEALDSSYLSARAQQEIENAKRKPFLAIHIRRGDLAGKSGTGAIEAGQITAAKMSLREHVKSQKVIVFTDSPSRINPELRAISELGLQMETFDSSGFSALEELLIMSHASEFFLGESSFGFWAAWLSNQRNPQGASILTPKQSLDYWGQRDPALGVIVL